MRYSLLIDIYKCGVEIIIDEDLKEICREFEFDNLETTGIDAMAWRGLHGAADYFMFFKSEKFTPALIAHEAMHIVCMIFEDRGIEFDNNNHEHASYLLEYLVKETLKFEEHECN